MQKPMADKYQLLIDGKWVDGEGGKSFDTFCPANGEKLASCAEASKADVDRAVEAAWKAFKEWKKVSVQERSEILLKIADIIEEKADHFAMVETMDNGKPIRETSALDIPLAVDHFRYFAGVIRAEEGSANMLDDNTMSLILKEPIGVVGQIVPWNFPFLMAAWKLAPALAAGNCVVFKPSSETSLSVLELAKAINDLLPPGVLNIVTGKGSTTGQYVLDHPCLSKLAFTGSTEVGYAVMKSAAEKLVPVTLELGGKSANIIFDDAPWDKAVEGVALGILFNQGQVCCAGSRIFVHEKIYDSFIAAVKEKFESIKVGLPWEKDTMMGSQINEGQMKKILGYLDIAEKEGMKVIVGGKRAEGPGLEKGAFMMPTLIEGKDNDCTLCQEEIFGPVAVVMKFNDEDAVIKVANASEYGLGGAVWTTNLDRAIRVSRAISTGRMWVNTYNMVPAGAPFGGYKKSGIGRETHKMILDAYTQAKNIYISLGDKPLGLY